MKEVIFIFSPITLGLALLGLLVLGSPISGYAASPHPCLANLSAHQGNLPGQSTFTFTFAKNCPPDTSNAISWNFNIYNFYAPSTPICSLPPRNANGTQDYLTIPPTTVTLNCPGLPNNPGKIKIAISYIVPGPSTMSHVDTRTNP